MRDLSGCPSFCQRVRIGAGVTDVSQEVAHSVEMSIAEFDELNACGEMTDPGCVIGNLIAAKRILLPPIGQVLIPRPRNRIRKHE